MVGNDESVMRPTYGDRTQNETAEPEFAPPLQAFDCLGSYCRFLPPFLPFLSFLPFFLSFLLFLSECFAPPFFAAFLEALPDFFALAFFGAAFFAGFDACFAGAVLCAAAGLAGVAFAPGPPAVPA